MKARMSEKLGRRVCVCLSTFPCLGASERSRIEVLCCSVTQACLFYNALERYTTNDCMRVVGMRSMRCGCEVPCSSVLCQELVIL